MSVRAHLCVCMYVFMRVWWLLCASVCFNQSYVAQQQRIGYAQGQLIHVAYRAALAYVCMPQAQ